MDVYNILRGRYPENEYALMAEVRDKAGFDASRSADYIAVNLWPSRGLAINGIEVKSFRSDWLSELKNPAKAENIFKYCDFFWLLTTDESIAKLEEIPASWGWLCIKGEKIFMKKEAPKLIPIALTKNFVCAMLKRACNKSDFVHISKIQDKIDSAKESARIDKEYKFTALTKELAEANKVLREFYEASGIDLLHDRWGNMTKKTGEAVKFIQSGGTEGIRKDLIGLEDTAKRVLNKISKALAATNPALELFKDETVKEKI